ncbi:MAG: hypothetical protein EOP18_09970 [Rhizobiaceae bacterium]|nr:MAG: hypothetical protein EOP18_09970 [Rhizobiaceae bacterium]
MKTILMFAILSSIAVTPVMAERFTRDGTTYDYKVKSAEDYQIISGTVVSTGETFRLSVKGSKVSGRMGAWPVQFNMPAGAAVASVGGATVLAAK